MLPPTHRMRRSSDFTIVTRGQRRARRGFLVVHHAPLTTHSPLPPGSPALVGLVVGRSVGSSVVRHRVSRRLRAQLRSRLSILPSGSGTVVRALPGSGTASSAALGAALDAALGRVLDAG